MNGLSDIRVVRVPRAAVLEAHRHLREMGRRRFEGFALWVGVRENDTFHVRQATVPQQRAVRSEDGVYVAVAADELHRMNVWLFQNKLTIIAQLHSHPAEAYHSAMDDAYPIATTVGCLSLVVPDFAARPFSLDSCAVYRLTPDGRWSQLSAQDVRDLINIVD